MFFITKSYILTTMVVNNIKSNLMNIGFTEYEAKTYVSLLMENPATAYEIAKRSAIPTSKIYEVLAKLSERGAVFEVDDKDKRRYLPLPPDELLAVHRSKIDSTLSELHDELKSISSISGLSFLRTISQYDLLIDKAKRMINEAKKTVLLSLWPSELHQLRPAINSALNRNIDIAIVHFGQAENPIGQMYCHPIETTLSAEHGGQILSVVTDSREVLFAKIQADGNAEGVHSSNQGFVTISECFIRHDIYIMKIVQRFGIKLKDTFGDDFSLLRNVFKDEQL